MFMGCDEEASLLLTLYKAIGAPKSRRADVKILIPEAIGQFVSEGRFQSHPEGFRAWQRHGGDVPSWVNPMVRKQGLSSC
jgi:hypothetical protein